MDKAQKLEQKERKQKLLFIIYNAVSVIFYTVSVISSIAKQWSSSPLVYFVIGATVLYIVLFVFLLLSKQGENDVGSAQYKSGIKLWKIVLNVFNAGIALLVLLNTLQADGAFNGLLTASIAYIAIAIIAFKVIQSLFQLYKWNKKRKKDKLKSQKKLNKTAT